jgi:hypothetical protein
MFACTFTTRHAPTQTGSASPSTGHLPLHGTLGALARNSSGQWTRSGTLVLTLCDTCVLRACRESVLVFVLKNSFNPQVQSGALDVQCPCSRVCVCVCVCVCVFVCVYVCMYVCMWFSSCMMIL